MQARNRFTKTAAYRNRQRIAAGGAVVLGFGAFGAFAVGTAQAEPVDSVTICQATGNNEDGFNYQSVAVDTSTADAWNQYSPNQSDIIPPFTTLDGALTFDGQGWSDDGQNVWNNGCALPFNVIPPDEEVPGGGTTLPPDEEVPGGGTTTPPDEEVPGGGTTTPPEEEQPPGGGTTTPPEEEQPPAPAPAPAPAPGGGSLAYTGAETNTMLGLGGLLLASGVGVMQVARRRAANNL